MKLDRRSTWRRAFTIGVASLVMGCGMVVSTPARHRPPLPDPDPMPDLAVEDVVEQLTAMGFDCWFDPPGDIGSSWNCRQGDQDADDYFDVTISSEESGPIDGVSAYMHVGREEDPIDAEVLDSIGAEAFEQILALVVPEEHRPTTDELHVGMQRNFPIELGGGWYLGFDRNIVSRSLRILHATDP